MMLSDASLPGKVKTMLLSSKVPERSARQLCDEVRKVDRGLADQIWRLFGTGLGVPPSEDDERLALKMARMVAEKMISQMAVSSVLRKSAEIYADDWYEEKPAGGREGQHDEGQHDVGKGEELFVRGARLVGDEL